MFCELIETIGARLMNVYLKSKSPCLRVMNVSIIRGKVSRKENIMAWSSEEYASAEACARTEVEILNQRLAELGLAILGKVEQVEANPSAIAGYNQVQVSVRCQHGSATVVLKNEWEEHFWLLEEMQVTQGDWCYLGIPVKLTPDNLVEKLSLLQHKETFVGPPAPRPLTLLLREKFRAIA